VLLNDPVAASNDDAATTEPIKATGVDLSDLVSRLKPRQRAILLEMHRHGEEHWPRNFKARDMDPFRGVGECTIRKDMGDLQKKHQLIAYTNPTNNKSGRVLTELGQDVAALLKQRNITRLTNSH
jgi:hypothetical protein